MAIYTSGFICEKLLEDKGGVMSAINIIDRAEVDLPIDVPFNQFNVITPLQITAVLIFKSDAPEEFDVVFTGFAPATESHPDGLPVNPSTLHVKLGGGIRGHQYRLGITIDPRSLGLWWFNVSMNGEVVLKLPFEVARAT
jgi:hypothetical protein